MRRVMRLMFLFLFVTSASLSGNNASNFKDSSKALSRRKRFVVFPDGSSFQLVFCAQNQGYLQVGDIIWFGNTAALAWELPSDPAIFNMFKKFDKIHEAQRRNGISKTMYLINENGKVINKIPYHKRPIINPAFAKRSIEGYNIYGEKNLTLLITELHKKHKVKNVFNELDEGSKHFHREGRKSLYVKLEKILDGLGWHGRECFLRMLCETGRGKKEQGTFLEEIMRAALTLPKGRKFDIDYHNAYDKAHFSHGDCKILYPECKQL